MNSQPIEKPIRLPKDPSTHTKISTGTILDVVNVFTTLQGEGVFSGMRAVFIRLAGCNLQCPLCDTDYTTNRQQRHYMDVVGEVMHRTNHNTDYLVVITGGEPFRQNLTLLTNSLILEGYQVQVETNGTLPPSPDLNIGVTIICSPKTGKVNKELAKRIDAYKYVLQAGSINPANGLPLTALGHSASPHTYVPPNIEQEEVFVQPADEQNKKANKANRDAVVKSAMEFGYVAQLQIHKYLGVE